MSTNNLCWDASNTQINSPLKRKWWLQQTTNFVTSFQIFDKNKVWYYRRLVCQQTILMKYHALFVNFEEAAKFAIVVCCKLRVIKKYSTRREYTEYCISFALVHCQLYNYFKIVTFDPQNYNQAECKILSF